MNIDFDPVRWLLEEIYKHIPAPENLDILREVAALYGSGPIDFPRLPWQQGAKLLNRWLDYQDFYAAWGTKQFHHLPEDRPLFHFFLIDCETLVAKLSTASGYNPPDASFPIPRVSFTDPANFNKAVDRLFYGWRTGFGVFPVSPTYEETLSYWLAVYIINAMHVCKLIEMLTAVRFVKTTV